MVKTALSLVSIHTADVRKDIIDLYLYHSYQASTVTLALTLEN